MSVSNSPFLIASQHPVSLLRAWFEDDRTSAWLYLATADGIIADVWVHNCVPAIPSDNARAFSGKPPPAAKGYADDSDICRSVESSDWQFHWTENGQAVALIKDEQPVAFVIANVKYGYSCGLKRNGPWGQTWDRAVFEQYFSLY